MGGEAKDNCGRQRENDGWKETCYAICETELSEIQVDLEPDKDLAYIYLEAGARARPSVNSFW